MTTRRGLISRATSRAISNPISPAPPRMRTHRGRCIALAKVPHRFRRDQSRNSATRMPVLPHPLLSQEFPSDGVVTSPRRSIRKFSRSPGDPRVTLKTPVESARGIPARTPEASEHQTTRSGFHAICSRDEPEKIPQPFATKSAHTARGGSQRSRR